MPVKVMEEWFYYGPIRKGARPLVDMLNAWASVGVDVRNIPDRRGLLNRFIGAHQNLRPLSEGR